MLLQIQIKLIKNLTKIIIKHIYYIHNEPVLLAFLSLWLQQPRS